MTTDARREQMRQYSNARYHRMKAQGLVVLKGRPSNKLGMPARKAVKNYINQRKVEAGMCAHCELPCENWNVVMFAWDHIDRTLKTVTLSQAFKLRVDDALQRIEHELTNCQLLCHNCHTFKTWIERDHDSVRGCTIERHATLFDEIGSQC
jgi:hypothetical protein